MSFPQGFLFQPSVSLALPFSPGLILGPRTDELGRSSSGSAFAPYSGPATSPGFNSHLPYSGEPRAAATLGSFVSGFDPSAGVSGSLDYHPFGALGPFAYGDPTYRKNATRDATATLKAWLGEHRKNPYPTKGEKIMLAIVTKMSLTQVSTWFANARRRLKKENKMTWTPRNRSEDEEEEDNIDLERNDEEDEAMKTNDEELEMKSEDGHAPASLTYEEDANRGFTDPDLRDMRDPGLGSTGSITPNALLGRCHGSELEQVDSCVSTQGPNPAPKPKLWSLAEIATSSDKSKVWSDSSETRGAPDPHSPTLPRCLYYTSSFIPSYGPLGSLHGGPGLQQTMFQLAEGRDCRLHELKKCTMNV